MERIFDKIASKKMKEWNINSFKKTHKKLYDSIIESMEVVEKIMIDLNTRKMNRIEKTANHIIEKHLKAIAEESMDSTKIMINNAVLCAEITSDEIIDTIKNDIKIMEESYNYNKLLFWQEVKREINKKYLK